MIFTMNNLAQNLATYLAPVLSGVTFYEDPNQQMTVTPCCFLQQRYSKIENRLSDRYLRTIGVDLTYLEDYNLPNLQTLYQAASEKLDECMETFPYAEPHEPSDKTFETAVLRTYDRNAEIDLDALHYKFELRLWVYPTDTGDPMQTLDQAIHIIVKKKEN